LDVFTRQSLIITRFPFQITTLPDDRQWNNNPNSLYCARNYSSNKQHSYNQSPVITTVISEIYAHHLPQLKSVLKVIEVPIINPKILTTIVVFSKRHIG